MSGTVLFDTFRRFRCEFRGIRVPFEPIVPKQFDWMLSSDGTVSAAEIIGSTILITSPAHPLGVLRIQGYFGLRHLDFPST